MQRAPHQVFFLGWGLLQLEGGVVAVLLRRQLVEALPHQDPLRGGHFDLELSEALFEEQRFAEVGGQVRLLRIVQVYQCQVHGEKEHYAALEFHVDPSVVRGFFL